MKISKEQLISVVDKLVSLSFDSYSFTYERVPVGSLHSGQSKPVIKICPHSGFESLPSYHVSVYGNGSSSTVTVEAFNPPATWFLKDMLNIDAITIFKPLLVRLEEYESFCLARFLSE
jgi:hypothetical protein